MKIINIVGARPNFMKIAPIIEALNKYPDGSVLSISINGCSDDETIQSFLEKQANTDWKFSEPNSGAILYVSINNNQANPFEIWFSILEEVCFIHESINDDGRCRVQGY